MGLIKVKSRLSVCLSVVSLASLASLYIVLQLTRAAGNYNSKTPSTRSKHAGPIHSH